jgi:hypothetical protein
MDLIVRRAQLTDRPSGQHLDIGIDGGRIVAIERNLAAEGATYDAALQRFGAFACHPTQADICEREAGKLNGSGPEVAPRHHSGTTNLYEMLVASGLCKSKQLIVNRLFLRQVMPAPFLCPFL